MKRLLFLILLATCQVGFAQVSNSALTTENQDSIKLKPYQPARMWHMTKGLIDSKLNLLNNLSDLNSVPTALTNLGGTTVGKALFTVVDPGAITFLRINADGSVSTRSAGQFLGDIGAQASITPAALSRVDDTNVTLTLGGAPSTALLQATSLTVGWTGQLSVSRGGSGAATLTGYLQGNGASALTALAITQGGLPYGGAAGTLAELAKNTSATRYISNTGTLNAPAWAQVDLTTGVTGILPGANGGTGNGFLAFSGPASTLKTFALPNASATILTTNAAVTAAQGGTGLSSFTIGDTFYASGVAAISTLGVGADGSIYKVNSGLPSWQGAGSLTKTDDTNVTLTLGGAPTSALVNSASITVGWMGTLSLARGGAGSALSDPGANILWGWDDTDNLFTPVVIGTNLVYTHATHTLAATGAGSGTVTNVSSANGALSVSNPTTTPVLTVNSAPILTTARTINGTSFDGSTNVTVTADANTLTNTTLHSTVVTSSLTTVGTVTSGTWNSIIGTSATGTTGTTGTSTTGIATMAFVQQEILANSIAIPIPLEDGGTESDLSATGGAGQYLKQNSSGAVITVSAVAESELTFTDITTNNSSTSKHGFLKKLSNNATDYMDGTGNWSTPGGGSGGWAVTGTTTLTGAASIVGTTTNTITFQQSSLGTTATEGAGLMLENTSAAANNAQQISGVLGFRAHGWKTNATAGSQNVEFQVFVLPVQGAASPSGGLVIAPSINNAAYTNMYTFSDQGLLSIVNGSTTGEYSSTGVNFAGGTGSFKTNSVTRWSATLAGGNQTFGTSAQSTTHTDFTFTPGTHTGGTTTHWLFTGSASTAQTASAETIDVDFALNRTVQHSTGALANQRAVYFRAPTYSFVGSSTLTTAATVAISGAPAAGSNATITNTYALNVEAGIANFASDVRVSGSLIETQQNLGSAWVPAFKVTPGTHTSMTASTEFPDITVEAATHTWAAGALATQRWTWYKVPTIAFASASTVTDAYTSFFEAPAAGTNATITNAWAIGANGNVKVGGNLVIGGTLNLNTLPGGKATFVVSGSGTASWNVGHGTAPSSPLNGDYWTTTDGGFNQVNGTTLQILQTGTVSSVTPTLQNRTITVRIAGTTYYITAKTTND